MFFCKQQTADEMRTSDWSSDVCSSDLTNGAPGNVAVMSYVLRLFWEDEIEHLGDYELMPLARLEQDGEVVRPVPDFTPPCMTLAGAPQLQHLLHELRDEIIGRARQLEVFKQPLANRAQDGDSPFGTLLALSVLNRYSPPPHPLTETPQTNSKRVQK